MNEPAAELVHQSPVGSGTAPAGVAPDDAGIRATIGW
jgi:hypothetical protein